MGPTYGRDHRRQQLVTRIAVTVLPPVLGALLCGALVVLLRLE